MESNRSKLGPFVFCVVFIIGENTLTVLCSGATHLSHFPYLSSKQVLRKKLEMVEKVFVFLLLLENTYRAYLLALFIKLLLAEGQ